MDYIEKRQEYNLKILDKIKEKINDYPQLRFGQILIILGVLQSKEGGIIEDPFYEEPFNTLKRINYINKNGFKNI